MIARFRVLLLSLIAVVTLASAVPMAEAQYVGYRHPHRRYYRRHPYRRPYYRHHRRFYR